MEVDGIVQMAYQPPDMVYCWCQCMSNWNARSWEERHNLHIWFTVNDQLGEVDGIVIDLLNLSLYISWAPVLIVWSFEFILAHFVNTCPNSLSQTYVSSTDMFSNSGAKLQAGRRWASPIPYPSQSPFQLQLWNWQVGVQVLILWLIWDQKIC